MMSFTEEVGKPEARQGTGEDGVGCESPDKRAETTTPEIVAGDPTKVVLLFFLLPLLFLFFVSFLLSFDSAQSLTSKAQFQSQSRIECPQLEEKG
jgi:hypothetical protein